MKELIVEIAKAVKKMIKKVKEFIANLWESIKNTTILIETLDLDDPMEDSEWEIPATMGLLVGWMVAMIIFILGMIMSKSVSMALSIAVSIGMIGGVILGVWLTVRDKNTVSFDDHDRYGVAYLDTTENGIFDWEDDE